MNALDRAFWIAVAFAVGGFLMVALGLIGEHRGWWNDVGELLITYGTIGSVLGTLIAALIGSTRNQAAHIVDIVTANGGKLDVSNSKLDTANSKLDDVNRKLDGTNARLGTIDETLTQQTAILTEIRDRL